MSRITTSLCNNKQSFSVSSTPLLSSHYTPTFCHELPPEGIQRQPPTIFSSTPILPCTKPNTSVPTSVCRKMKSPRSSSRMESLSSLSWTVCRIFCRWLACPASSAWEDDTYARFSSSSKAEHQSAVPLGWPSIQQAHKVTMFLTTCAMKQFVFKVFAAMSAVQLPRDNQNRSAKSRWKDKIHVGVPARPAHGAWI